MKKSISSLKIFSMILTLTVFFMGLAVYSIQRVIRDEPQIVDKVTAKISEHVGKNGGVFLFNSNSDENGGHHVSININGSDSDEKDLDEDVAASDNAEGGAHSADSNSSDETSDEWSFPAPRSDIAIKVSAADLTIKSYDGENVVVKAEGILSNSNSGRLLKVDANDDVIDIQDFGKNFSKKVSIEIMIPIKFNQVLKIKSVSGEIDLKDLELQKLEILTVSGETNLHSVKIKDLNIKAVSGEINLTESLTQKSNLLSVSGDINLKLKNADDQKYSVKTVSGHISNPYKSNAKSKNSTQLQTTSGNIVID